MEIRENSESSSCDRYLGAVMQLDAGVDPDMTRQGELSVGVSHLPIQSELCRLTPNPAG
jgi:hypothetical protein